MDLSGQCEQGKSGDARREGKVERHIRLLAPLAFVSPRIVSALLDGTAPADLTLTKLARALPYSWADQERRVVGSAPFHRSFKRPAAAAHCMIAVVDVARVQMRTENKD